MIKKVYITNSSGGAGKDTFASMVGEYISLTKYSSIDLVKNMYSYIGIDKDSKDEKKRKLFSDTKDMLTKYDDIPFKDISSVVSDFKNNYIETEVLFIDIREPEEIARAVDSFGAKTILMRNPNVKKITTNHADANVENYNYDYIIENDGTLEQLNKVAKFFVDNVIKAKNEPIDNNKTIVLTCSNEVIKWMWKYI